MANKRHIAIELSVLRERNRLLIFYPLGVEVQQISRMRKCLVWSGYWFVGVVPSSATPTNQSEGQSKLSNNPEIRRNATLSG